MDRTHFATGRIQDTRIQVHRIVCDETVDDGSQVCEVLLEGLQALFFSPKRFFWNVFTYAYV